MLIHEKRWLSKNLVVGVLMAAITAVPAVATVLHPEGTLKLADRRLAAGSSVHVGGEKFVRSGTLELVLVGLAGRVPLGKVETDSVGGFTESLGVPANLEFGSYRLVAISSDGDEVASLNVELMAAPEEPEAEGAHSEAAEPTAEPLALDRAESPWVTGGAVVGIVFALAAGGLLLRKPRGTV
jgi:hypothetical protein